MKGNSTTDLVAIDEDDVSYFKEMLGGRLSKFGLGAALLAAIPAGLVGGPLLAVFPLVAFAGSLGVGGLFVPSSPVFRHRVNARLRAERRQSLRTDYLERLLADGSRTKSVFGVEGLSLLESDVEPDDLEWTPEVERYRTSYLRMRERMRTLRDLAERSESQLSDIEVDKLDDATVDFLRLVYSRKNLLGRLSSTRATEVQQRISEIERQIEDAPPSLKAKLMRIQSDLQRTAMQVSQLPARDAALAAQLLHMSETFEELYHRITADPGGTDLSGFLQDATSRLSIEEELDWATEAEVAGVGTDEAERRLRAMQAQRQSQGGHRQP